MASLINNLTNYADQVTVVQLSDGSSASIEFIFNGTTEAWTANITYGNTTINSLGLCCYPNILRQWRNIIPFGLAIVTTDQTNPFDINDFASGRVLVYVLTQAEVAEIEATVFGAAVQV